MKKLIILSFFLLMSACLSSGCEAPEYEIKIKTDITKYTPLMSSAIGIGMTPQFETNQKNIKVQYHWTTTNGRFLLFGDKWDKEIVNSGEKVIWSPLGEVSTEPDSIIVTLKVEDIKTGKMLAQKELTIEREEIFYIVKP
ncbi:hypothetical protein DCCM_2731 [Desulfocucumis palustris]|uniref:Uncharacterized protein n=1 Tax=Desulfocucumis palustris TaxID=1898651 RepID=A0A2L2XBN1_9FIRM|nr:hypothetical protein [Desulfocucumis palustris]GBF33625.1 hypothetical protein DCCM_2731 [Desulfocucumis palustris]